MIEEEQQELINQEQQQHPNHKIRSSRLKKEFQFLQGYQYEVDNSNSQTIINFIDIWPHSFELTEFKLFVPEEYPFKQPKYKCQSLESPQPISSLIQEWSPKYKITELIDLIILRTQQNFKLQKATSTNFLYQLFKKFNFIFVIVFAILLRVLVGLGSYSGKADYPNLGDFQAHRNWMSITVNRPINEWYLEEGQNPWWRIDYPPGAAYLSFIFGQIYKKIQPSAMLLQQGYESQSLTAYMRFTVLLVDFMVFIPAVVLLATHLGQSKHFKSETLGIFGMFIILIKPDIVLIDHGHFQYNSLVLGLVIASIYFMLSGQTYLCCFLFTIAINCKQMATYYCLGFPCALIGLAMLKYRTKGIKILRQIIIYAIIVISVFFIMWSPWLGSMQNFRTVLGAIFPIHRGLYQLKVPNFWCVSDPLFKWQRLFQKSTLMVLCGFICLFLSLPSMLAMVLRPTKKIILIGFATIAMTFFLFSYHVHQKSILLPLALIPFLSNFLGKYFIIQMTISGCLGMYHLLVEDGQHLQYFVCIFIFLLFSLHYYSAQEQFQLITKQQQRKSLRSEKLHFMYHEKPFILMLTFIGIATLHLFKTVVAPPQHLPYLYNYLFAAFSFMFNIYFFSLGNLIVLESIQEVVKRHKKQ